MKKASIKRAVIGMMLGALMFGMAGCQHNVEMVKEESETQSQSRKEDGEEILEDVVDKATKDKLDKIKDIVDHNFYFEVDEQTEQDGTIQGYMESLGDRYSVYYTAEEYAELWKNTEGDWVSLGGVLFTYNDANEIIAGMVYGPAKVAGIKVEDALIKVNGEDITSQDIDEVSDELLGEEGTEITITIYRASDAKEYDFTLPIQKIEIPAVEYKMLENHIGYVQVLRFSGTADWQYIKAIQDLNSQGMEGLIVDLRDNQGGDMEIAAMMLDYMLPEGNIGYLEDKDGNVIRDYNSSALHQFDKPLVVLVNGHSASAAEFFTGAIKDYETGTIIGETTYGKGISQKIFPFADGSAIKLTVAQFFAPNGNDIHVVGIEPDVEVELDEEAYRESGGELDNQLQTAIEYIMDKTG